MTFVIILALLVGGGIVGYVATDGYTRNPLKEKTVNTWVENGATSTEKERAVISSDKKSEEHAVETETDPARSSSGT